jgi:hypothetical protein
MSWLNLNGEVQGDLVVEVVMEDNDKMLVVTGAYLAMVKLSKRILNWIPMFGLKLKIRHKGASQRLVRGASIFTKTKNKVKKGNGKTYLAQFQTKTHLLPK